MYANTAMTELDMRIDEVLGADDDFEADFDAAQTGEWRIGEVAAATIDDGEALADFVGLCRRRMIDHGASISDIYATSSAMVELGTSLLTHVGRIRVCLSMMEDTGTEICVYEPEDLERRDSWRSLGLIAASLAQSVRSVQLLQRRTDGLRVRATMRLDASGRV